MCKREKQHVQIDVVKPKYWEPPLSPIVPGPDTWSKTFNNENAALIEPKPSPET